MVARRCAEPSGQTSGCAYRARRAAAACTAVAVSSAGASLGCQPTVLDTAPASVARWDCDSLSLSASDLESESAPPAGVPVAAAAPTAAAAATTALPGPSPATLAAPAVPVALLASPASSAPGAGSSARGVRSFRLAVGVRVVNGQFRAAVAIILSHPSCGGPNHCIVRLLRFLQHSAAFHCAQRASSQQFQQQGRDGCHLDLERLLQVASTIDSGCLTRSANVCAHACHPERKQNCRRRLTAPL